MKKNYLFIFFVSNICMLAFFLLSSHRKCSLSHRTKYVANCN